MIGAVNAFNTFCVVGIQAQQAKAEGLGKNAIVATALNPLCGYMVAAELVKDAMEAQHHHPRVGGRADREG